MYKNLIAEMAKKSISKRSLARSLNLHENTIKNKLSGKSKFDIKESFEIKRIFFPNMDLQYLFTEEK